MQFRVGVSLPACVARMLAQRHASRSENKMSYMWNPWHGCKKISEGCLNCYMYEQDKQYKLDKAKADLLKILSGDVVG